MTISIQLQWLILTPKKTYRKSKIIRKRSTRNVDITIHVPINFNNVEESLNSENINTFKGVTVTTKRNKT